MPNIWAPGRPSVWSKLSWTFEGSGCTRWEDIAPETARRTLEVELLRLRDLFDFRCLVEGMIARAAAERRTANDIAELNAALAAFRRATAMSQARQLDQRLHGLARIRGSLTLETMRVRLSQAGCPEDQCPDGAPPP